MPRSNKSDLYIFIEHPIYQIDTSFQFYEVWEFRGLVPELEVREIPNWRFKSNRRRRPTFGKAGSVAFRSRVVRASDSEAKLCGCVGQQVREQLFWFVTLRSWFFDCFSSLVTGRCYFFDLFSFWCYVHGFYGRVSSLVTVGCYMFGFCKAAHLQCYVQGFSRLV